MVQDIYKNPSIRKAGEIFFVLMINLIENVLTERSKFGEWGK